MMVADIRSAIQVAEKDLQYFHDIQFLLQEIYKTFNGTDRFDTYVVPKLCHEVKNPNDYLGV